MGCVGRFSVAGPYIWMYICKREPSLHVQVRKHVGVAVGGRGGVGGALRREHAENAFVGTRANVLGQTSMPN